MTNPAVIIIQGAIEKIAFVMKEGRFTLDDLKIIEELCQIPLTAIQNIIKKAEGRGQRMKMSELHCVSCGKVINAREWFKEMQLRHPKGIIVPLSVGSFCPYCGMGKLDGKQSKRTLPNSNPDSCQQP